jgi:hypothetical protein
VGDRLREIRARVEKVLPMLNAFVRQDIEELLSIASSTKKIAAPESAATLRTNGRATLTLTLEEILRGASAPMSIPALTKATLQRGWTSRAKDPTQLVRTVLLRPPFARASRARSVYAPDRAPPHRTGPATEPSWSSVRGRARAVLEAAGRPMTTGEVAAALVASGWTAKSRDFDCDGDFDGITCP